MALIKCSECGKEISDKAKECIHCGNPIFKEKVKTMEKKEWSSLTTDEKVKVYAYRKLIKQWWIGERVLTLVCAAVAGLFLLIFFLTSLNMLFLFVSLIPLGFEVILSISSSKEEKLRYDNNVDLIYENEILK